MSRLAAIAAVLALASGCAPATPPDAGQGAPPLLASVQVTTSARDTVEFSLQVTNTSLAPIDLEFASGQTHDFIVTRGTQEVWRWSADRMFTQALRTDRLAAGETRAFVESWATPPGASGEYSVRGILTTRTSPIEQVTTFRVQ